MTNLAALAAQLLAEGFDPATSPISDFENLPDGIYDALLEDVQWRTNDGGTEWLSMTFTLLNEGFENRKAFGNIFFSNEKMLSQNIKQTMKSAFALDIELGADAFDQPEINLVEAMKEGLGKEVELELKTSTSKKNNKSFQNFTLSKPTA